MTDAEPPLRLNLDSAALVANWQALARLSGTAACGAAVKADGYGLGARAVVARLAAAGCRDFFVATWAEAAAIADLAPAIAVLHGIRDADLAKPRPANARPVLNTPGQIARWRAHGGGACDVMIDTGMNRLGLTPAEARSGLLDGLTIDTLMSHLACADEDAGMNTAQRAAFVAAAADIPANRLSMANSAGIALGPDWHFDLTRPGLALYGGIARSELADSIRPVVQPEAQVVQRRIVPAGATVGYGATWRASQDTAIAILNIGYADGWLRAFSAGRGAAIGPRGERLPVIGRVSMDLTAVALDGAAVAEGDWLALDFDLERAAAATGLTHYELLTLTGQRYDRRWR